MKLIRLLGNIVLLAVVCVLCALVMLLAYGRAMVGPWQGAGLATDDATWAWIDGQPVHVRTWGPETGQPLVLVHGFDVGGADLWAPIGPALGRAGYRVIAADLPPLGRSSRAIAADATALTQADLLVDVLDQMGAQGATGVAQGWGSAVALELAGRQPELVGRWGWWARSSEASCTATNNALGGRCGHLADTRGRPALARCCGCGWAGST